MGPNQIQYLKWRQFLRRVFLLLLCQIHFPSRISPCGKLRLGNQNKQKWCNPAAQWRQSFRSNSKNVCTAPVAFRYKQKRWHCGGPPFWTLYKIFPGQKMSRKRGYHYHTSWRKRQDFVCHAYIAIWIQGQVNLRNANIAWRIAPANPRDMTANHMKKLKNIKEARSNKSSRCNNINKVKKSYRIAQIFSSKSSWQNSK